jgi:glutathione peroxidase
MFAKIDVNGAGTSELYEFLKLQRSDKEGNADIAWNFTKFLVDGSGNVIGRFAPQVTPEEIGEQVPSHLPDSGSAPQ